MSLPFDTLTIHRMRGLQDVELTGLGRVNLLVGGNDSGKTSVLEALSLYCNPLTPVDWVWLASRRDPLVSALGPYSELLRWLFPHKGETQEAGEGHLYLSATGRGAVRRVQASYQELRAVRPRAVGLRHSRSPHEVGERDLELNRERRGARIQLQIETSSADVPPPELTSFTIWDGEQVASADGDFSRWFVPVRDVRPVDQWLGSVSVEAFSEIRLSGLEESVRALLHEIDPRILGLEVLAPRGDAVLYLKDSVAGLVPLSMYGDGIRRTLLLALALPQVKGGVLLIDELETAIHVSALGKVFRWMLAACKQYDVQVFATTHSLEVVDAILGADETPEEDIVGFRLERTEGRTSARRFGEDLLKRMRYERGLDVR
ncbi:AAA family ATPase [Archangium gephyra]|uniref:AAA family ATPase n=1 Tax=Archangium gephyra TaxID=48 RepID=UPI003B7E7421